MCNLRRILWNSWRRGYLEGEIRDCAGKFLIVVVLQLRLFRIKKNVIILV